MAYSRWLWPEPARATISTPGFHEFSRNSGIGFLKMSIQKRGFKSEGSGIKIQE
jgi:hypothetical protein